VSAVVADTATIIWWLAGDPRLSEPATDLLQAADDGDGIHVSAITLVDIWYATHKRTDPITTDQLAALDTVLADPEINIHVLPVTPTRSRSWPENPAGTSSPTRSTA
jgi:PIN domain nuclease of toxin-antitoxin system